MISVANDDLEFAYLNDESGLTGIICPKCGKRIPLLEVFSFDLKKGVDRNGIPQFVNHVDMEEDYDCECGASFRVVLDCKYAITSQHKEREVGKFQEETVVPLDPTLVKTQLELPEK